MSDDESYKLTPQGIEMMLNVLIKAANKSLITFHCFTEANISDYIQTLADQEEIWEGTMVEAREQRMMLLAMVLPTLIVSTKTEYN